MAQNADTGGVTAYRAALPMYDPAELRSETDAHWRAIRAAVPDDLNVAFERPATAADMYELLADQQLLLSQTCWGPMSLGLNPDLEVIAQPDFSAFEGGIGPLYRSVVVGLSPSQNCPVPRDERANLAHVPPNRRLGFNDRASLSGYLCLDRDLPGGFDPTLETGSHRDSLLAVADGLVDIAAIDCRTWAQLQRIEPAAGEVRILGWTKARTGLPYVCSPKLPEALKHAVQDALLAQGAHPPSLSPIL